MDTRRPLRVIKGLIWLLSSGRICVDEAVWSEEGCVEKV